MPKSPEGGMNGGTVVGKEFKIARDWQPPENYDQLSDAEKYSEAMLRERYDVDAVLEMMEMMDQVPALDRALFIFQKKARKDDEIRKGDMGATNLL